MTTGIRRVHNVDNMTYKNWGTGDGGATFDNNATIPWYSPDGVGSWWVYNNSVGSPDTDVSYLYQDTPATGSTFLVSSTKTVGQERVNIDWGIDFNTTNPSGVYFMAASATLDQNSYRVKQKLTTNTVHLEKMTGAGSAQFLGSFTYAEGAGLNYFRVRYFPTDYKIQSDVTIQAIAGRFIFYAGDSYNSMTNIGSMTDPTPIEVGSYNGYFIGANGSPDLYLYTYADDFWPMVQRLKTHHSLKGPSSCWMWTPKFYFEKWLHWSKGDYIQVFYSEEDGNQNITEELDFYGQYQVLRNFGKDSCIIISHSPLELANQHFGNYGPYDGTSTGYMDNWLDEPGGETYKGVETYFPRWVNGLNVRAGSIALEGRADAGLSDLDLMKRMSLVENYYIWYAPEQQLYITDLWRDKTSTTIDCGSWNSRFLDFDVVEDLTQTTTQATVYYDIGSSASYNDNITTLGSRAGLHGMHIDLHVGNQVEAQAIGSTLVERYGTDTYVLDLYFLARFTYLRPGDKVKMSLPHIQLGGDYNTTHANWVPVTIGILEKEVDTQNNSVRFRVNATYSDSGNLVGYQRDQHYFSDMLTKNYGKTMSANANHL